MYYKEKRVVTINESFDLIDNLHRENAHAKERYIMHILQDSYYGIVREMVRTYITTCSGCNILKKVERKQAVKPIVSSYPRERIIIDLIDAKKYNKNKSDEYKYILTVVDHYSNFTMIYPQKTKSQEETVKNVTSYIRIFGAPDIVQADNGKEFVNQLMTNLYKENKIKEIHSRPYNPHTNGKVERVNRIVEETIERFLFENPQSNWISFVERVIDKINSSINSRTHCKPRSLYFI